MAKRPPTRSKASDPATPTPAAEPKPKPKRTRTAPTAEQEPVGPPSASPNDEDIRRRAYERYQKRGGNHGQHFDDWLEAEKELKTQK